MDDAFEKRKKIIYELMCDELYVPMKLKELAILLQVPKDERNELKSILDVLEAEGRIHLTKKGKYMKGEASAITGIYQAHPKGFGFVSVEGEKEDIFIPEEGVNGVFQGDTVEVTVTGIASGKRREGFPIIRGFYRIFLFRWSGQRERWTDIRSLWSLYLTGRIKRSRKAGLWRFWDM